MSDKLYILYDARARGGQGTDDATVLCMAQSEKEALKDAKMFGETACYLYNKVDKTEEWLWDTDMEGNKL